MDPKLKTLFEKQQYRIYGNSSAVKICYWTKESIRGRGFCYKQKFYGIQSHRCLQMTPCVDRCNHNCVYCWRPMDYTSGKGISEEEADNPEQMIPALIKAQKDLLVGFKGFKNADKKKLKEAFEPKHAAISLAGEPTLYPKLNVLIEEFHKQNMTTFLVTNGTMPNVLKSLQAEPTQLYISLSAPNENIYKKINRPLVHGGWNSIRETLNTIQSFSCNTVIRLTLLKSNMTKPEEYTKLIEKAQPKFIECKAYMHVGASKDRLPRSEMPLHEKIVEFAKQIEQNSSYTIKDEKKDSRVVLLAQ